jgi:hypothetical protein
MKKRNKNKGQKRETQKKKKTWMEGIRTKRNERSAQEIIGRNM